MARYYYKSGNYPTTMQAMHTEFNKELYQELFDNFKNKYNLKEEFNLDFSNENKYCLNKTAYIVFNKDNQIIDYAFEEFMDFVWILQVNNIDKVQFEIPCGLKRKLKNELEQFSDRIVQTK